MEETSNNAAVQKLLDYANGKNYITWDEVTDLLGANFVASSAMEEIIQILNEKNIQLIETDIISQDFDSKDETGPEDDEVLADEDAEDEDDIMLEQDDDDIVPDAEVEEIENAEKLASSKNRLVIGDKDSNVDDPIRLYLRDIGKENLLTAEDEVKLSKTMEDGNNIIKNVIKNSGIMIPEFFTIAQKAFTKIDLHEPGKTRKEINEEMAVKKRIKAA